MNKCGEILIVDDDIEDIEIIAEVYKSLAYKNKLMLFSDGEEAYAYLQNTHVHPFLIISDINMPKMNGFELRDKVYCDDRISGKIIPFIFLSTGASKAIIRQYCQKSFHGCFEKKSDLEEIGDMLDSIISYWMNAIPSD